ncbi:MAG: alcohol dehydrogenase catalytic domain-containing protein, partial [Clostridiales bacterium]|nr:alcohol dehydrogenase catalytic domain-containing protein [Clostridiales bacterium]
GDGDGDGDMKSLVYYGSEEIRITDTIKPEPKQEEALIKVKSVGICGSDVHGYSGKTGRRIPPMIMGHEFSGIVSDIGNKVKRFKIGDRVVVHPVNYCGTCEQCKAGLINICPKRSFLGVMDINGAMAEYVCACEKQIFRLPDNLSFTQGAMVEPLAVAHRAVEKAGNIELNDILVVGAGTIGLLVVKILKSRNPGKIIVSDLSDYRLGIAEKSGADIVINPTRTKVGDVIACATNGRGVDIAFEAVGASVTVQSALGALKNSGTCIWIGNSAKMINIDMQEVVIRELRIYGIHIYTGEDFAQAIRLLADGVVDINPVVSKCITLEEAPGFFKLLANVPEEIVKVIINL